MIDLGVTFFFQLVNFVILFLILKHFLFEPVSNFMQQRSDKITNKIESAEQKEQEAQELKENYKAKISDAKEEAREIIENGKYRGQKRKEEIIAEAEEEADKKIQKAEDSIARAKQEAREELKDEVSNISLLMTKKALDKVIDEDIQEQTIENYIQELDEEKLGEVQ
ncbi:MAG: F0F1 ATP synthase subunit B [Bacillota bacterium]